MAKIKEKEANEMSFLDHLEVLRWTLVRSAVAVFIGSALAFIMKGFIFNQIILLPKDPRFFTYRFLCTISKKFGFEDMCITDIPFIVQSRTMAGQFSAHIWTSITVGFILAFPFIIYEIWKFIKPGLYPKEQKNAKSFIIISSLLFFIGIVFGYYVITPLSVNFFGGYRVADQIENNIDLTSYIALLRAGVLSSGLLFEIPIIIYFLTKLGLVTPAFLKKYRKYALVIVLILAALITPPDVISQIIVTIPMMILYEISIYISKFVTKKENQKSTLPKKV
ncbi:twin-arginine translocase subunit TatC [Flavobacteriaceae bacterium F08102]|nr:twin-arginine translocase subunit TatC [Flavobacteriaceae bacterium F08102]